MEATYIINKEIDKFIEPNQPAPNYLARAEKISSGFPANWVDIIKAHLNITDVRLANVLGVSKKQIGRFRNYEENKQLPVLVSDRLYRLINIFTVAIQLFNDSEEASEWLKFPQYGLGDKIPLDLIGTEAGAREIELLLGRIEYGVY